MDVSLETPSPHTHTALETSHIVIDILFLYCHIVHMHKIIFYYFLRSAIGNASARNMSSSADVRFLLIYEKGRRFDSHRGQAYFSSLPGVDTHSE